MDISTLRKITNYYQDLRLISLKDWKHAVEIQPRDPGGPYLVAQAGYAPEDLSYKVDEFVLDRSGKWLSTVRFYALPLAQRRAEFIFATAAEVMQLLGNLSTEAETWPATDHPGTETGRPEPDELNTLCSDSAKPGAKPGA